MMWGGRANPRDFARFSLMSYLKIGQWSLPNLEVRSNEAIVHFEGKAYKESSSRKHNQKAPEDSRKLFSNSFLKLEKVRS